MMSDEALDGFDVLAEMCEGRSPEEVDAILAQFREVMKSPFFRSFMGIVRKHHDAWMDSFVTSPEGRRVLSLQMNEDRWRGAIVAMKAVEQFPHQMEAYLSQLRGSMRRK